MRFTRLRVSGFKSFPDPIDLRIDEGLTGIVGPNGCGKSNIVEALRWVMGESSARGIRGAEMEDVIFNGAATRPPFDFAEVALVLEGPVEGHVEAGAELTVSRRIGRGTGSVYRIAGKEVRARDVQLLFADAGSGARSAAFISQGQVTAIVDAKADERRRLLEEAAGIGGLHSRRREAELRLAATERNLALVVERLAEQERQLAGLARQQRQAERFRRLQNELRLLEKLRLLLRLETAQREAAARRRELGEEEGRHAGIAAELEVARRNQEDLEKALRLAQEARSALATAHARAEERLRSRRLAIERERSERMRLERRIEELETEIATLCDRLRQEDRRATEFGTRKEELEREAESLCRQAVEEERAGEATAADLAATEERLRALLAEESRIGADLEAADRAMEELYARRRVLEARLSETERELAAADAEGPTAELAALEEERADLRRLLGDRERAMAGARDALADLEREYVAAQARRDALLRERDRSCARAGEIEAAIGALEERRRLLEAAAAAALERRKRLDAERRELRTREAGAAAQELESEIAGMTAAAQELEVRLAECRQRRGKFVARRREAAAERSACEQERMRLESEIAALEGLLPATAADSMIDRLELGAEEGRALMAALGEELLLGTDRSAPAHWREPPARNGADLPLPEGVEPLSAKLAAPPALTRRLAMIGLTDAAHAEALHLRLAPGQLLVSHEGGVWRWDGLVRRPEASAEVIARLDRRRRLRRLRQLLAERQRREMAAAARLSYDEEQIDACDGEREELSTRHRQLERQLDALRHRRENVLREAANAARRLEAITAEERDLEQEMAGISAQREALEAEAARLRTAREEGRQAAVLDEQCAAASQAVSNIAREVAKGRVELERLAEEFAALRRREAVLDREIAGRRARLTGLGERVAALRAMAEAAGIELGDLGEAAVERQERLARLREAAAAVRERRERLESVQTGLRRALEVARQRREQSAARLAAVERERAAIDGECRHLESLREDLRGRLEQLGRSLEANRSERELLALQPQQAPTVELEAELAGLARDLAAREEERQRLERALSVCREKVDALAASAASARERIAGLRGALARIEGEVEAISREIREALGRPARELLREPAVRETLATSAMEEIEGRIERLKRARERLGEVNLRAAREHAELEQAVAATRAEEAELRAAVERLRAAISAVDREGRRRLLAVFETVDRHFRTLFRQLFGGGEAHLRLTRLDEPFAAGLELEAMPPGKKLQHVSLLSGGEKSLAALALVFAFFLARPSPLCVLDEVDAALDDANVERFVTLMSDIAGRTGTRFLVITHHPLTMARMDRLYGVTMTEPGVSRLLSVMLETAVALRATA